MFHKRKLSQGQIKESRCVATFCATKWGSIKFLSYQELTSKQLLSAIGSSAQLTMSDNQKKYEAASRSNQLFDWDVPPWTTYTLCTHKYYHNSDIYCVFVHIWCRVTITFFLNYFPEFIWLKCSRQLVFNHKSKNVCKEKCLSCHCDHLTVY